MKKVRRFEITVFVPVTMKFETTGKVTHRQINQYAHQFANQKKVPSCELDPMLHSLRELPCEQPEPPSPPVRPCA